MPGDGAPIQRNIAATEFMYSLRYLENVATSQGLHELAFLIGLAHTAAVQLADGQRAARH